MEWAIIAPLIPPQRPGGRHRETDMREAMNAVRYVLRTGCQWRQLPKDFPPRSTVYNYFWEWTRYGVLDHIHHLLLVKVREMEGREASPTAAIIDTQAVKATEKGGLIAGYARKPGSTDAARHRGDPGRHPGPRLRRQPDPQDALSVSMDCKALCRWRLYWSKAQSRTRWPTGRIGNRQTHGQRRRLQGGTSTVGRRANIILAATQSNRSRRPQAYRAHEPDQTQCRLPRAPGDARRHVWSEAGCEDEACRHRGVQKIALANPEV